MKIGSEPHRVEWIVAGGLVPYDEALAVMEAQVEAIARDEAAERVWLVEHPPLYTAGTSARDEELRAPRFPVYHVGRGGRVTYHGPGQRVVYVMLDLSRRGRDIRAFVCALESWLIAALARLGVEGQRRTNRVGVWVPRPDKPPGPDGEPAEDKIAAVGIRLRRWVSYHGVSLNVAPDLAHFAAITPCGIANPAFGVTSLADLGHAVSMAEVDAVLRETFEAIGNRQ